MAAQGEVSVVGGGALWMWRPSRQMGSMALAVTGVCLQWLRPLAVAGPGCLYG